MTPVAANKPSVKRIDHVMYYKTIDKTAFTQGSDKRSRSSEFRDLPLVKLVTRIIMASTAVLGCLMQVLTEFDDDGGRRTERFSVSSHEVLGVVDTQSRRVLSFMDAVRRRILHPETGIYCDPLTGRLVYPSDAIRQGLIKTKLLDAPTSDASAWQVPAGRPVLPGELDGTLVPLALDVLHSPDITSPVLPGELSSWPGTTSPFVAMSSSPHRVRRTISGWFVDL